jgi:mycothiol system anti-sigma-R factor
VKAILECRQATKLVDAFVDDELSSSAKARLRHHVAGCTTCATSVEEKIKLKRLVRLSVGNLTAPATLRDRLRTRIGA